MTSTRHVLITATALFTGLGAVTAQAGPITDQLKSKVDAVIKTLDDPALKSKEKTAERRQAVRAISNEIFDWTEMSKRSLGRHWASAPTDQRDEFVRLFTNLIEAAYVGKLEGYSGEKVEYVGEAVEGDTATARTKVIIKQGQAVPIDYRMIRQGDRWLIYDVSVENVSLVSNYRAQFDKIIATSSYQELLKKMKTMDLAKQ